MYHYRPVGVGGAKGAAARHPQILACQLTLSQPRGQIMPTKLLLASPGFSNLPMALHYIHNSRVSVDLHFLEGQPAALREARLRVEAKLRQIITAKSHRVPFLKRDLVAWVLCNFYAYIIYFFGSFVIRKLLSQQKNSFIILTKWNSDNKK